MSCLRFRQESEREVALMSRKKTKNTKGKIISAAWKLFYDQGYDDTTIDEIIAESGTSKGSDL